MKSKYLGVNPGLPSSLLPSLISFFPSFLPVSQIFLRFSQCWEFVNLNLVYPYYNVISVPADKSLLILKKRDWGNYFYFLKTRGD